jgi:DNA-binding SARP family transcriptional activator
VWPVPPARTDHAIVTANSSDARTAPTVLLLGPISISGPISLDGRGGRTPVGGPRTGRVMAALALRASRPVSMAYLVEAVWGARPPRTSRHQVHNGLARLRHTLATRASDVRLSRVGHGYQLDIDPDRVDVHAFSRDLGLAARASADGDLDRASTVVRAGLDHWFGDALGGITDGALATEAARLEEMRLAAYEDLFGYELARGRTPGVAGEIAALANRHPLRERLVLLLMTALCRTGRSAEALRVFADHRRRMREELGVEPDRGLRTLQIEIIRDGAATVPGAGPGAALERDARVCGDPAELAAMLTDLATLATDIAQRIRAAG